MTRQQARKNVNKRVISTTLEIGAVAVLLYGYIALLYYTPTYVSISIGVATLVAVIVYFLWLAYTAAIEREERNLADQHRTVGSTRQSAKGPEEQEAARELLEIAEQHRKKATNP